MNYIKELKAFKNWLLLNDLTTSGIALWHTLMAINNMAGWREWFTAPNSTLQQLTNLSKQGLVDARNLLIQKNLIEYKKGRQRQAGTYRIISQVKSFDPSLDQTLDPSLDQTLDQSADQHLTITKHKLNKTKHNMANVTEEEKKMLSVLADVKNYPFDFEKDLAYIRQLSVDFPELDIHEQLKSWSTYKLDKPLTAKSNPRSQIRTWCQKAKQWGRGKKKKPQRAANGYWDLW